MFFETKNLCFSYYKCPLTLKDVNFSFAQNSKTVVLASKEMGKTTFLKVLSGFEESRFGNIYFNGKELKQISDEDKNFSLVLSDIVLFERKTIKQNIDFQCEMNGIEKFSVADLENKLNEYNINVSCDTKIKKLSLFEKRKIQILRAIIKSPKILFLDDQFDGLEENEKAEMFLIYENLLNRKDLSIIFAVSDETYKNLKISKFNVDNVLYLNLAEIVKFKSFEEFEKSYGSLNLLKFLNYKKTEQVYIEKDGKDYYLCKDEVKLFKFDSTFNKQLNDLNLEFADIEDCEILCLSGENISDLDSFAFNKMLKENKFYIFSKLTGNRII